MTSFPYVPYDFSILSQTRDPSFPEVGDVPTESFLLKIRPGDYLWVTLRCTWDMWCMNDVCSCNTFIRKDTGKGEGNERGY